jgi:hypothetical protein
MASLFLWQKREESHHKKVELDSSYWNTLMNSNQNKIKKNICFDFEKLKRYSSKSKRKNDKQRIWQNDNMRREEKSSIKKQRDCRERWNGKTPKQRETALLCEEKGVLTLFSHFQGPHLCRLMIFHYKVKVLTLTSETYVRWLPNNDTQYSKSNNSTHIHAEVWTWVLSLCFKRKEEHIDYRKNLPRRQSRYINPDYSTLDQILHCVMQNRQELKKK